MFFIKVYANKEWEHSVTNTQDSYFSKSNLTGVEFGLKLRMTM